MAYETRDNSGSLFKNDRKEKDTHPDYTGSARIDGHDCWVSLWHKKSQSGRAYLSLSFKRKDGTAARPEKPGRATVGDIVEGLNDGSDVPF